MSSSMRVPDQLGHLVLHETGATISSSGDLENDERTAEIIYNMLSVTDRLDSSALGNSGFNKISICYKDFCYVICMSNKKIHIVKKKLVGSNITSNSEPDSNLIDLNSSATEDLIA
ncbi:hypothetical protein RUM44_004152 [Polyplax serrata]|uniref:Late endosomal/lysosomal adaptor and MAPK and MTOR activator 4 n=1 Tax=Polyplax serrata TaxID=468196 RepID=A0ABR1B221_POLSC